MQCHAMACNACVHACVHTCICTHRSAHLCITCLGVPSICLPICSNRYPSTEAGIMSAMFRECVRSCSIQDPCSQVDYNKRAARLSRFLPLSPVVGFQPLNIPEPKTSNLESYTLESYECLQLTLREASKKPVSYKPLHPNVRLKNPEPITPKW